MNICARKDCGSEFVKGTHNQKFCSAECCRVETNRRIMEKYYDKRDQRLGKVRYCSECRTTKLSRYNNDKICAGCSTKQTVSANQSVIDMLLTVSWHPTAA